MVSERFTFDQMMAHPFLSAPEEYADFLDQWNKLKKEEKKIAIKYDYKQDCLIDEIKAVSEVKKEIDELKSIQIPQSSV